jgi:hypothetical protein
MAAFIVSFPARFRPVIAGFGWQGYYIASRPSSQTVGGNRGTGEFLSAISFCDRIVAIREFFRRQILTSLPTVCFFFGRARDGCVARER